MQIELTRAILMPWRSIFLGNSTIHFHVRMFLYRITCFLRIAVSLLCQLQAVSKIHVPIYPKGNEIFRLCDRHNNETVTLGKHVTKYKHMRKWLVEFLRNFENPGIKIARINSIRITTSINLLKFCTVLRVRCDVDIFKLTARAQSINTDEVYASTKLLHTAHKSHLAFHKVVCWDLYCFQ